MKMVVFGGKIPINPTDRIVLTPGVVVAGLGPQHLVAAQEHWHSLRDQQGRDEVADLTVAKRQNFGVVGRTFDAAIPTNIVVVAIPIRFAVGDIVFAVDGVEHDDLANTPDLYIKLRKTAGDTVTLDVIRDGKRMKMPVRTQRMYFRK